MNKEIKAIILLFAISILSACVGSQWKPVTITELSDAYNRFRIQAPAGWMQQVGNKNSIVLSRDGLSLQFIKVGSLSEDTLQTVLRQISRDKQKVLSLDSMLPSELAGIFVSVFKNIRVTRNIKIVANGPAIIGRNINGFRLVVVFTTDKGLQVKREVHGFAQGGQLVFLIYQAPALYYFPRDQKIYKRVIVSFKRL